MRKCDEDKKRLSKELDACRIDAIKEVAKAKDEFNKQMAAMNIANQELTSKNESITEELETSRQQSTGDLSELQASLKKSSSTVASLSIELKKLQEQRKEDERAREAEANNLRDQIDTDAKIKQDLQASIQSLRAQFDGDGRTKHDLEINLREKSEEIKSLRQTIERLEERNNDLEQTSDDRIKSGETLEISLREKSEEIARLETKVDELEQTSDERLKSSETSWLKKVEECKKELTQVKEKLDFSVERLSKLSEEKAELLKVNATLKESSDKAKSAKHSERKLRGELAQKKQMISILQSNEKHLEEHVAALEDQINKLVNSYESKLQISD